MVLTLTGKGVEIDKPKDIIKNVTNPVPVHDDLVPIGNSPFYVSPETPVDPRDCQRWEDSPWCGGNPISKSPIGIDVQIAGDECNVGINIQGTLGFVKLPNFQAVYRQPGCTPPNRKDEPPPLPGQSRVQNIDAWGANENAEVFACTLTSYDSISRYNLCVNNKAITQKHTIIYYRKLIETFCPGTFQDYGRGRIQNNITYRYSNTHTVSDGTGKYIEKCEKLPGIGTGWFQGWNPAPGYINRTDISEYSYHPHNYPYRYSIDADGYIARIVSPFGNEIVFYNPHAPQPWTQITIEFNNGIAIYKGRWGTIRHYLKNQKIQNIFETTYYSILWDVRYTDSCIQVPKFPPIAFPPYNPPPKKCCKGDNMSCCNNYSDLSAILALLRIINNKLGNIPANVEIFDQDENRRGAQKKTERITSIADGIRLSIKESGKISKIIGIDDLPITLPDSVVEGKSTTLLGKALDFLVPNKTRKITNLLEFLAWMVEQDSAVFGKWMQTIIVEDNDPIKKGNQKEEIVLPNIAEALKENILLTSTTIKTEGLILDICLKILTEIAHTKIEVAEAQARIRDVQEYLDYDTSETTVKVPIQITIPSNDASPQNKNDLYKYLQPSETTIKYDEYNGKYSLEEKLVDILQVLSSVRANNMQK